MKSNNRHLKICGENSALIKRKVFEAYDGTNTRGSWDKAYYTLTSCAMQFVENMNRNGCAPDKWHGCELVFTMDQYIPPTCDADIQERVLLTKFVIVMNRKNQPVLKSITREHEVLPAPHNRIHLTRAAKESIQRYAILVASEFCLD